MSDFLSTGEFAASIGVTDQSVRNWCEAGTIPAARDERGRWRIAPEAAEAAIVRNRRANNHGGTRRDAGRKKDHARHDGLGFRQAETVEEITRRDTPPLGAVAADELLLLCTPEELRCVIAVGERVGLGQRQMDMLLAMERCRKIKLDNDEREGRLLKAEDVEATTREAFSFVRLNLTKIASAAADVAEQWLPDDRIHAVLDLLRASQADADLIAAVSELIERPPGLTSRLRQAVAAEVDRACTHIAEWGS